MIVVDVFSFTTCIDIAISRGAAILPYAWNDTTASDYAQAQDAELAGRRRKTRYSLAPESYLDAPAGLRCVLPSPNGAQVTLAAAAAAPVLLAAALFERYRGDLAATLDQCGSGRELDTRGHHNDKLIAGELNASVSVPRFDGTAFVAAS